MPILKKAGSVLLGLVLLTVIFLAKDGDVQSLLRDLGLSGNGQANTASGPAQGGPAQSGSAQNGSAPSATATNALAAKLTAYITCLNRVDVAMHNNYEPYSRSFPAAFNGGTIYHRSFKIAPYEVDNSFTKDCAAGLVTASKTAPANSELDGAGLRYAEALTSLVPLLNETDDYLNQQNYRDDGWRRMREELHPKITASFATFFDASDRMRAAVESANLMVAEQRLNDIEKQDGRAYRWHELNVMHRARLSLDRTERAVQNGKVETAEIEAAEQSFGQALDGARAYIAANPTVTTRLGNKPVLFYIESRAVDFLTALKTLRRDTAGGDTRKLGPDMKRITESFNGLVDDYNLRVKNGN
ncbi:DUF3829 domain-containing protein [Azospirillum picis]|uniref:DUF3829 domain-containing protein n=1 Tax=Azospirillum picis TaxID=488438 RepID=A0ABU0MRY7_9PROT|nr:DUF3829 domain-containing protein [Azospirillum picis]MBP2302400.1 hypothetical protein [Azospirillum picis]MDQ0535979.1 hypothetical protein [Azospirillum picis]